MVHHVLVMSVNPGFGGQKLPAPVRLGSASRTFAELRAVNWGSTIASKSTGALLTTP